MSLKGTITKTITIIIIVMSYILLIIDENFVIRYMKVYGINSTNMVFLYCL